MGHTQFSCLKRVDGSVHAHRWSCFGNVSSAWGALARRTAEPGTAATLASTRSVHPRAPSPRLLAEQIHHRCRRNRARRRGSAPTQHRQRVNRSIIPASSILTYVCRPLTSCHKAFLHGAPRALLHLRREHISRLLPPTNPPPFSPLLRASLPCDGPILRSRAPRPLLSRACNSPFAMSFGTTHARPFLAARCYLLHVCAETRHAPFKLAAACGPISSCC